MFKLFTIIRVLVFQSPLNSSKGRFIVYFPSLILSFSSSALRGMDYTNSFLVKVWLTLNPIKGLAVSVSFIIMLNAYILMVSERVTNVDSIPCYSFDRRSGVVVSKYRDSLWLTIITFLTVGYGDFYPTTNVSRYILIVTVICGQLYSAIVIGLIHG